MPTQPEPGSSLPDVILGTAIVYLFVVAAIRISGKREVGQMSVLDLMGHAGPRRPPARRSLREEMIDGDEVRAAVRAHGLARVEDARLAVLETDGAISVSPFDEDATTPSKRPPTRDRSA